ncbi:hypothetical protein SLNSH_06255 [Alsobacter soli]|uniref:Uncharacterized protein n=1 Tax=Alsobacter soli TaxID=2109933 RepID=A0A2T1HWH9_9HYPH|nr:HGGxSTG domain-containing protein [Alsobacter soli]PSC05974.1 hypothetical protein SLNSH_06255 [Alsobacter soli]
MSIDNQPARLRNAPRCGARTRSGGTCQKPALRGRPRCQIHGCGKGAGAPKGERNGSYKHGRFTVESEAENDALRAILKAFPKS